MTDTAYSVTLTGSSLILALIVAAMLASPTARRSTPPTATVSATVGEHGFSVGLRVLSPRFLP